MKKLILLFTVIALSFTIAKAQAPVSAKKGISYGEKINAKGAIDINALASKMGDTETLPVKITGKVVEVCTAKGCWMKLENANGETTRVTFKDYAFFMPKDIIGKTVALDGVSMQSVTSVDELQHYAKDAGKSEEDIAKITAPKNEIKYEAKGVLVM